jgi:hypothetical protein
LFLTQANAQGGIDSKLGALLYQLASTSTKNTVAHLPFIAKQIAAKKLVTGDQVTGTVHLSSRYQVCGEIIRI